MSVTAAQSAANARTAARNVAARLGFADTSALTYDERVTYNHALAAEILKYPQSFTAAALLTASGIVNKAYGPQADATFDWGELTDALAAEAKITLPAVGNKLLVAAVALGAAWIYFNRRPAK